MKRILFGAGETCMTIVKNSLISDIDYICDNYKVGGTIEGIPVISFERLTEIHSGYEVIVSVKKEPARTEIQKQLNENKIPYKDIFDSDEIKHAGELSYWKRVFVDENGRFINSFYEKLMLAIAEEESDDFLNNKVVADFGCGPRGSLAWMKSPFMKMGIDVLTQQYLECFGKEMIKHNMVYVTSTETCIPLPDESVDCLVTINSLDHVRNMDRICSEMTRILKKGGCFLASFNLLEPRTECEPQTLTEQLLKEKLLNGFKVHSYRIGKKDSEVTYKNMFEKRYSAAIDDDSSYILWVRGEKI